MPSKSNFPGVIMGVFATLYYVMLHGDAGEHDGLPNKERREEHLS